MPEREAEILIWLEEIQQYQLPRWEELPDIELYMDQVITLIERYLLPLVGQNGNKVITPAMINNYVKLNIMYHAQARQKTLSTNPSGPFDCYYPLKAGAVDYRSKGRDLSAVQNLLHLRSV